MLPFRMFARRSLSCSSSLLRKCKPPKEGACKPPKEGECQCQPPKEPCEAKPPKKAKGAGRQCEASEAGPVRDSGIPDHCSKEHALECAKKLQALQKQWENVARMCDPGERAAPKGKRPGCPVQPPAREEGGISPVVLLLAGAALIAAIVWWVINNKDELEKGKDKEEKGEKKDEGGS